MLQPSVPAGWSGGEQAVILPSRNRRPTRAWKGVFATFVVLVLAASGLGFLPESAAAYTSHQPIRISGDADFHTQAANEGWPGSGTASDPYIISGYSIPAFSANGIDIRHTSVHFAVRDNIITGNGGTYSGIFLSGVKNGQLEDNVARRVVFCYYLNAVRATSASGNQANDCEYGYSLVSTFNSVIEQGTVTNARHGIHVLHSQYNTIQENTILDSASRGIYVHNGEGNILKGNTIVGATEAGIYLRNTGGGGAIDNTIESAATGIWITDNIDNLLDGNTIRDSTIGINPDQLNGADIRNSRIFGGTTALALRSTGGHTLINNVIEGSSLAMDMFFSSDNTVTGGAIRNTTSGILGFGSLRNTFTDITLYNVPTGIYLRSSRLNDLEGIHAIGCGQAIRLDSGRDNLIEDSTFADNTYGITFSSGLDSDVRHSVFTGNDVGLRLLSSDANRIWNNLFDNDQNVQITGTVSQTWSVPKTPGTNIIGGPFLGGNWWSDYEGVDADSDGLGDLAHGPFPYGAAGSQAAAQATDFTYGPDDPLPLMDTSLKQDRI